MTDRDTPFGYPLTEREIEAVRCLIGNHYYKDVGDAASRCCPLCGAWEDGRCQ